MSTEDERPDSGEAHNAPEKKQPGGGKPAAQSKTASQGQAGNAPNQGNLEKAIAIAKRVADAQKTAANLRERATKAVNPKERFRLLQDAYNKEVEAVGQSKLAKRLSSGVWQGGTAGGGIGAGIAMGLGAVTGTLVTGLVSIPTVLLGGLVGAGVGGLHGPWFKLGLGGDDKKQPKTEEEIRAAAMKEAEALDQAVETGANTVPQPPEPPAEEGEDDVGGSVNQPNGSRPLSTGSEPGGGSQVSQKKKPRKLQVRSGNEVKPAQERKKPKKLEVRSTAERKENV